MRRKMAVAIVLAALTASCGGSPTPKPAPATNTAPAPHAAIDPRDRACLLLNEAEAGAVLHDTLREIDSAPDPVRDATNDIYTCDYFNVVVASITTQIDPRTIRSVHVGLRCLRAGVRRPWVTPKTVMPAQGGGSATLEQSVTSRCVAMVSTSGKTATPELVLAIVASNAKGRLSP